MGRSEGTSPMDNVDMKSSSSVVSCTVANSWLKVDSLLDLNSLGLTEEAGDMILDGDTRLENDDMEAAKMLGGGGEG